MEAGAANACEIERLPEELLSAAIRLTTPGDARRAAAVSRAFRAAADCDVVWSRFLPGDLPPLAGDDGQLSRAPPSNKARFLRLAHRRVVLADGRTSMWLDRETGVKCFMLSARKLNIAWGDTPAYWRWIPITGSSFSEAAELRTVCWLEIRGKIDSKMLSKNSTYSVYLVFKDDSDSDDEGHLEIPGNILLPRERADGWKEVELGDFYIDEGQDGEICISLRETSATSKSGLIVQGIEIRPAVSPLFRAAADSDAVWSCFLPRDLPPLAEGELHPPPAPAPSSSKKQLFMRLSDRPVLLADGLVSMWLDRESGAKCYMLSARALGIVWGSTPQYWRWIPLTGSRFAEAAELLDVCWLEFDGKMHTQMLTQNTKYAAYMVFKIADHNYGLGSPIQEAIVEIGEIRSTRQVCLQEGVFSPDTHEHVQFPQERADGWMELAMGSDGWMELEMGKFDTEEGEDGEVSISLLEIGNSQ
ncbi:hypothetical protein HU200_015312 [Digitaria exilis]|uniref:F-box domain-containing protein n=1 Tax=Digitaria exilis TaxID=1010633 RepID=A0A835FAZ7_9POAL|nr:hypothetical protein HU200_015312 [Digitaria exilis]